MFDKTLQLHLCSIVVLFCAACVYICTLIHLALAEPSKKKKSAFLSHWIIISSTKIICKIESFFDIITSLGSKSPKTKTGMPKKRMPPTAWWKAIGILYCSYRCRGWCRDRRGWWSRRKLEGRGVGVLWAFCGPPRVSNFSPQVCFWWF